MRTRAEGPGKVRGVLEPSDPIVLTDEAGRVVAGPVFWCGDVEEARVLFDYDGTQLARWCVGVLRADGVLAWQGDIQYGLYPGGRVDVDLAAMMEPESLLCAEDHEWLREHAL